MPQTIEQLAIEIGRLLRARQWQLVTAESCTGGGLAFRITDIPGSSDWFERGFVTYSNLAKVELLGVKEETLAKHGAVSEQTAREMVEGSLDKSKAQIGLSITGIAGPDGGSLEKPVGTVWFAWKTIESDTQSTLKVFSGDRQSIRNQAIEFGLHTLINFIS